MYIFFLRFYSNNYSSCAGGVLIPKKTAYIYSRVSTSDQRNSIEGQKKLLTEYCEKNDIEIVESFIDFAKSGKDIYHRPFFQKMINQIKASETPIVDYVLCTKLDRFARSMADLHINVGLILDKGIKFKTLSQDFDLSTPQGKLMFNIMGSFAEFERELNNERTREGYRAAIERGVVCHRPKIDLPKKKVLDYLDKGLSATSISKILGVKPATVKNRLNEWGYYFDDNSNTWIKQNRGE